MMLEPEMGQHEESDNEYDDLGNEFLHVRCEPGCSLDGIEPGRIDSEHEQGHGKGEDRIDDSLQPVFRDPVGIGLFVFAHTF